MFRTENLREKGNECERLEMGDRTIRRSPK